MSHDKIGPHEQRLRELRVEREAAAKKKSRLVPYAGKEPGGHERHYGNSNSLGVKKGPRKPK